MIISHSNKFIFFKPIKTAGSSIERSLSCFCNDEDVYTGMDKVDTANLTEEKRDYDFSKNNTIGKRPIFYPHTSPDEFFKLSTLMKSDWSDYFKISMIRNPYDMAVSYFWYSYYRTDGEFKPFPDDSIDTLKIKFEKNLERIGDFTSDKTVDGNIMQYIEWLSRKSISFIHDDIDFYIKYENLEKDYKHICDKVGIHTRQLPNSKSQYRSREIGYKEYYTQYSKFIVTKYFRHIIHKFDYKF
jgi:hypothetical protein